MKIYNDKNMITDYYEKFELNNFFGFDVLPYISIITFEDGEEILKENEIPNRLYYMVTGNAKLYLSHNSGRISLINFMKSPCFIGEMELLGVLDTSNGVIAVENCTCIAIDTSKCKEKLIDDKIFLRNLCIELSKKATQNTKNYSMNQSYPLSVRLAKFIIMTTHGEYYREKHAEAAEYLGVTYRHLLYVLADFVKRGLLEKRNEGYKISDRHALEELSKKEGFGE